MKRRRAVRAVAVRVEVARYPGTRRAQLVLEAYVSVILCTPGTTLRDVLAVACEQVRGIKGVRESDQLCATVPGTVDLGELVSEAERGRARRPRAAAA
jgi:hypothetical protein